MSDPLKPLQAFNPVLSTRGLRDMAGSQNNKAALEKACRDFESLFVNYMLQQMRETIPEDSLFGGGQAEKIYTGMLDTEVSKNISQTRSMGLANLMYKQMSALGKNSDAKK